MNQRPRIYYTETQKALMWDRWQKGESLQQIAQLFDRNHSSIQRILAESGDRGGCCRGRGAGPGGLVGRHGLGDACLGGVVQALALHVADVLGGGARDAHTTVEA